MILSNNRLFGQYVLFVLLFLVSPLFSQENDEDMRMINKAHEMAFFSPNEALKLTDHMLKKASTADDHVTVYLIEADINIAKGDYDKTAESLFKANRLINKVNDSLKAEIVFHKAFLARTLKLYNQFDNYVSVVKILKEKEDNASLKSYLDIKLTFEEANMFIDQENYTQAITVINTLDKYRKEIEERQLSDVYYLIKAKAYKGLEKYEESYKYYNLASASYVKDHKNTNLLTETALVLGTADLDYFKKDYTAALDKLTQHLKRLGDSENNYLLEKLNNRVAINYLGLNDKENHLKYNDAFLSYNKKVYDLETSAVNSAYNYINEEQALNLETKENSLKAIVFSALGALFLIALFGNLLYFSNKAKKKRLKEIIGYLEITNKLLVDSVDKVKSISPKKLSIPTETEQNILVGLKKFESTVKYTSKDMSLATLAAQLDTNTKYLSEIINKHYNDNFNAYINKLRVNYIIEKLKNEPEYLSYKISYLAEESGFSSHSSFATVFKSITGIAPTVFIDMLGKEIHNKKA